MQVSVIGAGLAGCEAAWQLARRGIAVTLYEMKPAKRTPAHHSDDFAELCCSNSLRSDQLENAVGLLKEELRRLGSLILACADETRVEAGGALAVDRHGFARLVTERVRSHPNITVIESEVTSIPAEGTVIVASGPLTSDALSAAIAEKLGDGHTLNFYDAAAPLVTYESVDMSSAWFASRYDKGTADYINCPLTAEEYDAFWNALTTAEEAPVHGFEDKHVFEGCMPVEVMARRGHDTLCYGPLKPRGLRDPKTGQEPYAVVQLRRGNAEIEQHSVHLGDVQGIQYFAKVGEVPVYQRDLVHMLLQPLPRRVQRDRVAVDADEASAGQPPADLERMARAAERTIQINAIRADIQKLDGLVQENGLM